MGGGIGGMAAWRHDGREGNECGLVNRRQATTTTHSCHNQIR